MSSLWALIAKVIAEVFGMALNTKGDTSHVENADSAFDTPSTPADKLLDKYSRM